MSLTKIGLALSLGSALLLAACGGAARSSPPADSTSVVPSMQGTLTVFAAASLTDAFNQMKSDIEGANPGAKVVLNYAGSQVLRTQLAQGAKADLFASADTANMDGATSDGSIDGQPTIFVHNKLAVVVPASNPKVGSLQDLAKEGTKIVIEQPSVPAGNYSRQALHEDGQRPVVWG